MLWEIIGLGAGSMPLTFRFMPPIGGILYWLRPGTIRLPPFPDRVPLTRGSTRTWFDVALYAGVLGAGGYLLLSSGEAVAGHAGRAPGPRRDRRPARPARAARPARQGLVPVRAPGNLRAAADRVPVPDRRTDRRLPARARLHLVGRRRVEAQQALPLRRGGDDQQHALEPLARAKRRLYRDYPRRSAPLAPGGASPRTSARRSSSRCRSCCSSPGAARCARSPSWG